MSEENLSEKIFLKKYVTRESISKIESFFSISLGNLIRNIFSLSMGAGIAQALMAISFLLTSRHLGTVRLGAFVSSMATTGLLAILFNWGLDTWLLRSGSYDLEGLGELLGNALLIKGGIGVLWLIGVTLVLPLLNPETFTLPLVLFSALAVWLEGLFSLILVAFKVLLRNSSTALFLIVSRGSILLFSIVLIALGIQNPLAFVWIRVGVGIGMVSLSLLRLPVRLRVSVWPTLRRIWRDAQPFALSDLFTSVYVQADTTIAAVVLSKEAVGLYAPASSLVNALFVIPSAWYFVTVPILIRVLKTKRRSIGGILGFTVMSFAVIGGVLGLGTWFISPLVPKFMLGESFAESGLLIAILSPIIFLKSCSFALAAILVSVGWQKRRVYVQALSAITNVILNLALIHHFGVKGIAVVYVVSETLLMFGYLGLVVQWYLSFRQPSPTAENAKGIPSVG